MPAVRSVIPLAGQDSSDDSAQASVQTEVKDAQEKKPDTAPKQRQRPETGQEIVLGSAQKPLW